MVTKTNNRNNISELLLVLIVPGLLSIARLARSVSSMGVSLAVASYFIENCLAILCQLKVRGYAPQVCAIRD